ncbi:hypothetical protein [Aliidiomarina quisquiliarum]|uniref:hypothetical protein n=1 Tax=Aliidiomarina quisquiliarum TaxID=2938947 RepID=UPI00208E6574|nr:hypothetical protein [Aliidiomarina quisquiliarum]MCO4321708.1 hypothetical protein [Aliidiomarina quisquiliarum]
MKSQIVKSPEYQELASSPLFKLMVNSWMAFNDEYDRDVKKHISPALFDGCSQVLENMVVTPHYLASSCCGLTYEHIPEMKIGDLRTDSLLESYKSQLKDFMKLWIRVKGPLNIVKDVMGEKYMQDNFSGSNHICEVCSKLYNTPEIVEKVKEKYENYINDIIFRFSTEFEIGRLPVKEVL